MQFKKSPFLDELETLLYENKEEAAAKWQKAYMRNQFSFIGVSKPQRLILQKPLFKKYPLNTTQELILLLKALWKKDEREFQYVALELALFSQKLWTSRLFNTFEEMIVTKSWWDTVDILAGNIMSKFLIKHPALITHMDVWVHDPNFWKKRTALLFQLKWKNTTDEKRLFDYCEKLMEEKEFFIRKAIGWALKEYSKTNPQKVTLFVEKNKSSLSPLSLKEANRYIIHK